MKNRVFFSKIVLFGYIVLTQIFKKLVHRSMSFSSCSSLKMQSHPHQNVVDIATSNISDIINGCQLSNFNKIFVLIPKRFRFDLIRVHFQIVGMYLYKKCFFLSTLAKLSQQRDNFKTIVIFSVSCECDLKMHHKTIFQKRQLTINCKQTLMLT